eukprot:CAMPEP_0183351434 /NCGR_PEP_ID=MMETSP0164_2-20130417/24845_1 /TAXON_ID=221442 /ORGANISM="Coccolithus pelagicus ssp braarudi, Strain PLY182g" /LENGTH=193 /DNA_ID=CAMNT_0025523615 /DNA_START=30 /DNA_END=611 /DNA_ORIENTATION=+
MSLLVTTSLLIASASAFVAPLSRVGSGCSVSMSASTRRDFLSTGAAALALAVPLAASADGANSIGNAFKARAIYGSRIYRLQSASAATILGEKNAFTLFISGAYRTSDVKETATALKALQKAALAAAASGDEAGAKSKVKEFIALGKIVELDTKQGGNFDPRQRRNPGAPPTAEIEAQMGTQAYALYTALPTK